MAIEPIKGFYVHDEATDTDGIAKYAWDAVDGAPDVENEVSFAGSADSRIEKSTPLIGWQKQYITDTGYILDSSNTAVSFAYKLKKGLNKFSVADGYVVKYARWTSATTYNTQRFYVDVSGYFTGTFFVESDGEMYYRFQVRTDPIAQFDLENLPSDVVKQYAYELSSEPGQINVKAADSYFTTNWYIDGQMQSWARTNQPQATKLFRVREGTCTIVANSNFNAIYALLSSLPDFETLDTSQPYDHVDFVQGVAQRKIIAAGTAETFYIPHDCILYVYNMTESESLYFPSQVKIPSYTDVTLSERGVPADAKAVHDTFETVLEPFVNVFNEFNEGICTTGAIDVDGEVVGGSNKVTDFIAIPKKYNKNLLYTHVVYGGSYAGTVAFYDADKVFIESVSVEDYITNLDTYEYIRAELPASAANIVITFSNETLVPQNRPQKKDELGINDWFGYGKNVVSDGCMTAMVRTALAYANSDTYGYGTEHTAFAESCIKTTRDTHTSSSTYEGERYQVDCSTYVSLIMLGITPKCSRYFNTKNIPADYGYKFNDLAEYEGYVYGAPQTGNTKRLYANSIADYAYKNGFLYVVDDNFNNVKAGDILFLSNQGESYNFFENIGHCMFVANTVALENGGRILETFEATDGTGSPCVKVTREQKPESLVYGARFPYNYVRDSSKNIAIFNEVVSATIEEGRTGTVDIATIELSEPLKNGNVYTAVIDAEYLEMGFFKLTINGASYTSVGYASDEVLKRPDGKIVIRFVITNDITITNSTEISLLYQITDTSGDEVTVNDFELYDGYVTPPVL